jgi:hypothetical protein
MMSQDQLRNLFKAFVYLPFGFILLGVSSAVAFVLVDRVVVDLLMSAIHGLSRWLSIPLTILIAYATICSLFIGLSIIAGFAFGELPHGKPYIFLLVAAWVVWSIVSVFMYCSADPFERGGLLVKAHLSCGFYVAYVVINIIAVITAAQVALNKAKRLASDKEENHES